VVVQKGMLGCTSSHVPVMTRQHLRFVRPAVKEVRVRPVLIFAPMTAFKKDVWQKGRRLILVVVGI
jgi:hypothetical protein